MLSNKEDTLGKIPLKTTLFPSFQMHQVVANQIKCLSYSQNIKSDFHPSNPDDKLWPTHLKASPHTPLIKEQWKKRQEQFLLFIRQKIQVCELSKIPL
jgi:hypothetical protein